MSIALLLVMAAPACTPPAPTDDALPGAPTYLEYDAGSLVSLASFVVPGDSLTIPLSWGPGTKAVDYVLSVTATGTGWSNLPSNLAVAGTTYQFKPINLAWDTTTFRAVVRSRNVAGLSKDSATATWKMGRRPGGPGPIIVDSSAAVIQLSINPAAANFYVAGSFQFCSFWTMLDGYTRLNAGEEVYQSCRDQYDVLPATERLPGYPVASGSPHGWIWRQGDAVELQFARVNIVRARKIQALVLFAGPFSPYREAV